jgi:hypothetical protein
MGAQISPWTPGGGTTGQQGTQASPPLNRPLTPQEEFGGLNMFGQNLQRGKIPMPPAQFMPPTQQGVADLDTMLANPPNANAVGKSG